MKNTKKHVPFILLFCLAFLLPYGVHSQRRQVKKHTTNKSSRTKSHSKNNKRQTAEFDDDWQDFISTTDSTGCEDQYGYVDLGLSVKWAIRNIGAINDVQPGDYYAWGETETKSVYDSDETDSYDIDLKDIGGTNYDVARNVWGGKWRMPTSEEFQELIDNCSWQWISQEDAIGYKVTGPNDCSIFLPAAGVIEDDSLDCLGTCARYWSSTSVLDDTNACCLGFYDKHYYVDWLNRGFGATVRPVIELK